ncbi:unnamed protein product [Lampetra planeri]
MQSPPPARGDTAGPTRPLAGPAPWGLFMRRSISATGVRAPKQRPLTYSFEGPGPSLAAATGSADAVGPSGSGEGDAAKAAAEEEEDAIRGSVRQRASIFGHVVGKRLSGVYDRSRADSSEGSWRGRTFSPPPPPPAPLSGHESAPKKESSGVVRPWEKFRVGGCSGGGGGGGTFRATMVTAGGDAGDVAVPTMHRAPPEAQQALGLGRALTRPVDDIEVRGHASSSSSIAGGSRHTA